MKEKNINTTKQLIQYNAKHHAAIPFINFYDDIITYQDLDIRTDAFACYLNETGINKGDVVSFMIGNTPAFFDVLLGAQKSGAIAGPISCWWQAEEVIYLVEDCQPKVLIIDPEYAPIINKIKDQIPSVKQIIINTDSDVSSEFSFEKLPEILRRYKGRSSSFSPSPGDIASLMYTSGTTGNPKGVMLTHESIICASRIKTQHIPVNPGEKALCVLPLFHSGGLNDLAFSSMYAAATIVLRKNFSAKEFWNCVEKYQIHAFYIVPTMWNILLRIEESRQVDTSSLRFGLSGAAPIPPEQLDECERRFHVPILEAYGLTENTGGITSNQMDHRKYGSIGKILPELSLKIAGPNDEPQPSGKIGEIAVQGKTVMKGYWNKPEATMETIREGWLYTGDIGYTDEDGFLYIVDRKKDMIIRGGVNVYPKEIENIIATHPHVDGVAVIPESHDKYGQVGKACIVVKRGEALTEKDIREFCTTKMAQYKVPETYIFRASLPKNAVGKIVKKQLIDELENERNSPAVPVAHLFEDMKDRFIPQKGKGVHATVSYHITGKGGGQWTVTIDDGKFLLSTTVLKNPTVYIVARDSDYHDIVTGKLDGITAVLTGKMTIEGDVQFMSEFRNMFNALK
jgi:long-chain acyl-CoA synthetase